MKPLLLACLLLLGQPTIVSAQRGNPPDQTQLVQTLINRIDQLEKRVAELEAGKPPATPATAPPAAMEGMSMGTQGEPSGTHPTLNIAGFSDFTFGATDQPGVRSGFNEGQFILHLVFFTVKTELRNFPPQFRDSHPDLFSEFYKGNRHVASVGEETGERNL